MKKLETHFSTKEKPLIYTSLLFAIPMFMAIAVNLTLVAILIGLVTVMSVLHHIFKRPGSEWWWHTKDRHPLQTLLLLVEIVLALALAVWSLFQLLNADSLQLFWIAVAIFVPSFILYLNTNYTKYVFRHAVWHFSTTIIISLSLF